MPQQNKCRVRVGGEAIAESVRQTERVTKGISSQGLNVDSLHFYFILYTVKLFVFTISLTLSFFIIFWGTPTKIHPGIQTTWSQIIPFAF